MVNYRRVLLPNGRFFFTVNLRNRRSTYLTDHVDMLRDWFSEDREKYSFTIDAIVIFPEYLHTIWTLPQDDTNYPTRWRSLKSLFTRKLIKKWN